jgi:hypothetical protein
MRLVAAGNTSREIGGQLFLSPRTVEMHVRSSMLKLDCRTRAAAVRRITELDLMEEPAGDRARLTGPGGMAIGPLSVSQPGMATAPAEQTDRPVWRPGPLSGRSGRQAVHRLSLIPSRVVAAGVYFRRPPPGLR